MEEIFEAVSSKRLAKLVETESVVETIAQKTGFVRHPDEIAASKKAREGGIKNDNNTSA